MLGVAYKETRRYLDFKHRDNLIDFIQPKPVQLYEWLLQKYAKEGDKILDTHLGSGSSRIAAYNGGYDFVGFEIDEEYFRKQEERFERHTSQSRIEF
jgi:site-specific DNA-methyltransferase (adenine-specific)